MAPTSRPDRVVVIAFGPPDTTRAALTRAHRLVADPGDVVVVPAHRGVGGSDARAVGTEALRAALPDDDATVLVAHDDVHLGRDGAAALLRAWAATGQVVVPWMNAPGSSQHLDDMIPADGGARARLARRLPLRGGPAPVVRTACLLADGARLRMLADRFITVAEGQWSDPSVPTVVAAGALAHHAERCYAPVVAPVDGPLLVAAMIVRDEAATLPDCLASLDGVVDRVEICDTGSVDDTIAIARAAGANVIERVWRDDFAWARNEVLESCRDAVWILQIDADERLRCDDPAALRTLLARLADSATVCAVPIDNLTDHGQVGSTHQGARVLRTAGLRYHGALHERARYGETDPVAFTLRRVRLEHLGYRRQVVTDRAKADRNLSISEAAYAREPGWETAFNLARSLSMAATDQGRVAALLHESLEAGDVVPLTWRAWALAWLGRHHLDAGDAEAAVSFARRALALVPADPVAGAVLADAAERLGRHDLVIAQRSTRLTSTSARPFIEHADATARVAGHEIASLLALGETDEAYHEALAALERDPERFASWPALIGSVAAAEDRETVDGLLVTAALRDHSGGCLSAFALSLPPDRAARLCLRYREAGGNDTRAVRDGLATAIVARDPGLVAPLIADAHHLGADVLDRLADAASRHGLAAAAADLHALAAQPRRRFVVCGTVHAGLAATGTALSAIGHPCGHETLFNPVTQETGFGALQGDASWYALPHLDSLPEDAVVLHQVRDPFVVIGRLLAEGTLRSGSAPFDFIAAHAPHVVAHYDEILRCIDYWITWNTRLARHADGDRPYVRYRVEDLGPAALSQLVTLLGSLQPADVIEHRVGASPAAVAATASGPGLPDGPLTDRLHEVAAALGYQRTPVA